MAVSDEQELAMKERFAAMKEEGTPLDQLRAHVMSEGVVGIRNLSRTFRIMDQDGDKKLCFEDFQESLVDCGLDVPTAVARECFNEMDLDGSGTVSLDEFLIALRPPLSEERNEMIDRAFKILDKDADDIITVEDITGVYSAEFHPKFQSGEWTEEQVLENWLKSLTDGKSEITREDFYNYYIGVSSSIDDDEYFVEMMKSAWKMEN